MLLPVNKLPKVSIFQEYQYHLKNGNGEHLSPSWTKPLFALLVGRILLARGLAYGSPDAPVGMRLQNGGRAESFLPTVDPQCKTLLAQGLGWLLLVSFTYVVCLLGYAFRLSSLASMVHLGITDSCTSSYAVSRFSLFFSRSFRNIISHSHPHPVYPLFFWSPRHLH